MWGFVCVKCGEQRKELEAVPIQIEVQVELNKHGEPFSYWEGELPTDSLEVAKLVCPVCGGCMEIKDVPCTLHEWGETKTGYGDWEGKVMRRCVKCGEMQMGTLPPPIVQDPVWNE